jgi:hypothetical protein
MRTPDIELTDRERELLAQIKFDWVHHDELRASIVPMVALSESLIKRRAVPDVRLLYFSDPDRNPGGRGRSRQEIFEKNGTSGSEVLAHPNFLPYLEYFVYGPKLPSSVISQFKEAASFSGHLTRGDLTDLIPAAKAVVRSAHLNPHEAADEFHKLVLECGAVPSSAETIRNSIRSIQLVRK